jgi:Bacterial regulatory proteins, luxR family
VAGEARAMLANLRDISGSKNQEHIEGVLAELNTMMRRESPKIAHITKRLGSLATHADEVVVSALSPRNASIRAPGWWCGVARQRKSVSARGLRPRVERSGEYAASSTNLIAAGNANKQIADQLAVTEDTIKGRVKSILSKLDANDRTHAAIIGLKCGIIEL